MQRNWPTTARQSANIATHVDFSEAYADLYVGRIAGVVNSLPNLIEAAKERPDVFKVVLPTFGPKKYFAWAGRKNPESASLNALIDDELRKLSKSGKLAERPGTRRRSTCR